MLLLPLLLLLAAQAASSRRRSPDDGRLSAVDASARASACIRQRCLLAAHRCNIEGQQPPRGITTDESGRVALCSVLLLQLIACVMPGSRSSTDPEHKSPRESGEDSEDESEILEESPCGRWLKRREEVRPLASPLLPPPYLLAVRQTIVPVHISQSVQFA